MKVRQSKRAKRDALNIFLAIAEYDLSAARRFAMRLDKTFETLLVFPLSGRLALQNKPNLRTMISDMNIIFYEVKQDEIIILRIIDGRMDVTTEFQE